MEQVERVHDHELWERTAHQALHSVMPRQEQMIEKYGLTTSSVQYFWSLDDRTITWSREGREFLRARITLVGSVDIEQQDWQWSWARQSALPEEIGDLDEVRRFGDDHAFPLLTWPRFHATPKTATQAHMMAAEILAAEGIWRDRDGGVEIYLLLHDFQESPASAQASGPPVVEPVRGIE